MTHKIKTLPLIIFLFCCATFVFADDHEMMGVVYRFSSMEHFGEALDKMTESTEFMDLVIKANEIGSLKMARMLSLM